MSKRDWQRHPAVGVAIFIFVCAVVSLSQEYQQIPAAENQTSYNQLANSADRLPATQTPLREPHPDREEWRQEKDLEAQRQMAVWACLMFFITSAGVWYVARTLEATRGAVDEARKATKAANDAVDATKEIGKIQGRAYLLVTPSAKISFDGATRRPVVSATVTNKGQTPAVAIAIRADVIYPEEIGETQTSPEIISFDLAPEGQYLFQYSYPGGGLPNLTSDNFPLNFTVMIRISYETAFGTTESEKFPFAIQYINERDLWSPNFTARILTEAERERFNERKRIDQ